MAPPVGRDPALDLDITAIYHVCNDFDMIRYFMRTFYQYQFNEVLCQAAGHTGPLYKCDFYNSTAAGDALAYVKDTLIKLCLQHGIHRFNFGFHSTGKC